MELGIVTYKDELMMKIKDDFPMEDEENPRGIVITLKKDNAKKLADEIYQELKGNTKGA